MPSDLLYRLTAHEAASAIAAGRTTSEALVRACLERIEARERTVGAWSFLSPEAALAAARACDRQPARGPLHGVPVAIKDVIDTADMPTAYGSPARASHQPEADAACVALLREAGAVILGKTVSTEYAAVTPGKTVNPHSAAHSPGGSSSGSAAAVADGMVPAALGTQTVGSTIRPASFCGAVGFKASFGTFSLKGVHAQAESLDTLGILTRSVEDIVLLGGVLLGEPDAFAAAPLARAPRFAFCPTPHWPRAEPATVEAMREARQRLSDAGAAVDDMAADPTFDRVLEDALEAQWLVLRFEFARAMSFERTARRETLSAALCKLLDDGLRITASAYRSAQQHLVTARAMATDRLAPFDAVLTPAAAGEAPVGAGAPTDLLFQRLWTGLRLPAITLPGLVGPQGLPVGVQMVGKANEDAALLAVAGWSAPHFAP